MMNKLTGGSAYPSTSSCLKPIGGPALADNPGMTLRQHYAGEVLKGLLIASGSASLFGVGRDAENKSICIAACELADTLIAAEAATLSKLES